MPDEDGEIGHNEPTELTAAEREALFFHHLRPIMKKRQELKETRESYNALRKAMKADGFKLKMVDAALEIYDTEDEDIIVGDLKERLQIARWMGLPVGQQLDMFAEPDRSPLVDKAYENGRTAGFLAKDCKPPHDEGSEAGQAWMKGWHDAQQAMRDDLQSAMEKRNGEKDSAGVASAEDGGASSGFSDGDQADNPPAEEVPPFEDETEEVVQAAE